jgi:hypothetical protein
MQKPNPKMRLHQFIALGGKPKDKKCALDNAVVNKKNNKKK